jgi:hypothetical protein
MGPNPKSVWPEGQKRETWFGLSYLDVFPGSALSVNEVIIGYQERIMERENIISPLFYCFV